MPEENSSGTTAKKKRAAKRPAAKKSRKRAVKASAAAAPATAPAATGDRLTEVARTIGSTMGDIVAKTKRVLHREPGTET